MSSLAPALAQIAVLVIALAVAVPLLGRYLAHIYTSPKHLAVERASYRVMRVDPDADQHWRTYTMSVLGFSLVGVLLLYGIGRLQQHLPLSLGFPALPADGAWNTAVSFVTNTNWQWYSGEAATGHLMQMSGLTVQNFVSAGVGMAVAAAFARALARNLQEGRIGNFWTDLVRTVVRVLLPISMVAAVVFVLLGVVQNFLEPQTVHTLTGGVQHITGGPVASQEAIKELGTNGGGFYNANSAHPFENPTPFTDIFQIFLLLVIPFSMAWAFGIIVGDRRQGGAILAVMVTLWGAAVGLLTWAEMAAPGTAPGLAGGAMEGKEVRFGEAASALFASSTTGTSTGAVNAMHDSLTAPGGGITLFNMMLGEVAPGGVGSGLYGMLMLAVVTVFLAGLMVGPHPGVPREEDRPARDLPGRVLRADHARAGARRWRDRAHRVVRSRRPAEHRAARPLRGVVRRHLGRQQQRLCVRRHHLGDPLLEHAARPADAVRPVPADGLRPRPRRPCSPGARSSHRAPAPCPPTDHSSWSSSRASPSSWSV